MSYISCQVFEVWRNRFGGPFLGQRERWRGPDCEPSITETLLVPSGKDNVLPQRYHHACCGFPLPFLLLRDSLLAVLRVRKQDWDSRDSPYHCQKSRLFVHTYKPDLTISFAVSWTFFMRYTRPNSSPYGPLGPRNVLLRRSSLFSRSRYMVTTTKCTRSETHTVVTKRLTQQHHVTSSER